MIKSIDFCKKMVLGTVQFGTDYGITNLSGITSKKEFFEILDFAWGIGINRFDTAPGYGSEFLLGEFIKTNVLQNKALVFTKIPSLDGISDFKKQIRLNIEKSLKSLGCPIDVLFFHDPSDAILLIKNPQFFEKIMNDYPISTIGLSAYTPEDILFLENCKFKLAYQFPFNIVDRRFEKVKMTHGKRYARSIFLQGILASRGRLRRNAPEELSNFHKKYHETLIKLKINPIEAAVLFVARKKFVDYFLIGVNTKKQLNDIISLNLEKQFENVELEKFVINIEEKWFDPRKWS